MRHLTLLNRPGQLVATVSGERHAPVLKDPRDTRAFPEDKQVSRHGRKLSLRWFSARRRSS